MNPSTRLTLTCRLARVAIVSLLPLAFSACAPNAWKNNPNIDAFMNRVMQNCQMQNLGQLTVGDLMNQDLPTFSALFFDMLSRFDAGSMSAPDFAAGVASATQIREDAPGIRCIIAQKTR